MVENMPMEKAKEFFTAFGQIPQRVTNDGITSRLLPSFLSQLSERFPSNICQLITWSGDVQIPAWSRVNFSSLMNVPVCKHLLCLL